MLGKPGDEDFRVWAKLFQTEEAADEPLVVVDLHAPEVLFPSLLLWQPMLEIGGYGRTVPEKSCVVEQPRGTVRAVTAFVCDAFITIHGAYPGWRFTDFIIPHP